jgi:bacterioferritin-associated ferredoxin
VPRKCGRWIGRIRNQKSEPRADPNRSSAVIVCSCNVITDHQVRSVTAERAARGTSEVYRCLGCSAECGRCARTIRQIMDEAIKTCPADKGCGQG